MQAIPVIMATAKNQIEDKVTAYEGGADDYLAKPFDLKELDLRIKAVTKRNDDQHQIIRKDVLIDLDKKQAYKKNKAIALTHKEFVILETLISQHGAGISRTDLLDQVRGSDAIRDNDSKLDVYISGLRKKLGR